MKQLVEDIAKTLVDIPKRLWSAKWRANSSRFWNYVWPPAKMIGKVIGQQDRFFPYVPFWGRRE